DWYFEHPFQHETIVVEDGTLRLAGGATINASNRLLVAEGGNAVFDINNRPVTVASLRGGGRIELGSAGSLRVAHRFSMYNMTQTIETILIPSRWRGTIAGGTAGATSLVFSAGPNSFHTWLGGSNAHAGVTLIEDGMLQVAHSWALGQRGAGNETLVRTNTSLRLVAGGMNVPEDLILLASGNGRPLVNAEGDNELSGTLRITTVTTGANVDIYLANEASNRLLRFSGVLTGMDNPSETNLQARIFLVAAPGATVEVSGAVANFTGGVTRLFLRRSSNDAPSRATFRLSSTNSTFDGGLTLLNGTLLVGADALASGPGAFGSNNLVVGASWAAVANENLAVLIDGPYTVGRNLTVNNVNTSGITTLGGIGAHTSVLSGTVTFGGSREIRLTAGSGGYVRITGRLNDGTNTVSLRKVGAGVVTLERAAGNDVDGSVIVEEGTLLVSNTSGSGTGTGPVQVRTNGWLGGTGIITGSLSVAGGLTFELSTPPASHDRLDVQSGLVFSNGAKVRVAVLGGATTGTYVLANAVGGVSGPLPALELTGTSWSGVLSMAGTELRLELMGAGGAPLTPYQAWAQARITNGLTNELDDADGDGVANWEEWVADSDPMVTNAAFGAVGIQLDGGNLAALFISSTQRLYTLEYTTSLEGNWWSNVPGQVDIPGSGGVTNLSMPAVTNAAFRLRVRVPEN
ncbi:MAG: hypothetical protein NZ740_01800, partial [Kiritimatiellae bacterium]|nr:hypothetical protein [Kiritimatiellia bacterium]MDW8457825.1 hypothetical protein [Verrucomicrobiota bacterium]